MHSRVGVHISYVHYSPTQNGTPAIMQIYKTHGTIRKKLSWRQYVFHISGGSLKYYKSTKVRVVI